MRKLVRIGFDKSNVFRETEMAYGIKTAKPGSDSFAIVYLPKSQIKDWQDKGERLLCLIPAWLAQKNELDYLIDTSDEPSLF
jgi:hypothetical protein